MVDTAVDKVTDCLECLELSGNLTAVRESQEIVGEMSGKKSKKSCSGKLTSPFANTRV